MVAPLVQPLQFVPGIDLGLMRLQRLVHLLDDRLLQLLVKHLLPCHAQTLHDAFREAIGDRTLFRHARDHFRLLGREAIERVLNGGLASQVDLRFDIIAVAVPDVLVDDEGEPACGLVPAGK